MHNARGRPPRCRAAPFCTSPDTTSRSAVQLATGGKLQQRRQLIDWVCVTRPCEVATHRRLRVNCGPARRATSRAFSGALADGAEVRTDNDGCAKLTLTLAHERAAAVARRKVRHPSATGVRAREQKQQVLCDAGA